MKHSGRLIAIFVLTSLLGACASSSRYPTPQPYPPPQPQPSPGGTQAPAPWPGQGTPTGQTGGRLPGQTSEPAPPVDTGPPPPRTIADASGPAVVALLQQADARASAGEPERAAAYIERAVAVEPRNPFIFQRLAALRLDQGEPEQAEAMARKSNSLAGDNPYIKAGNWQIIAQARRMRGDNAGAVEADSRSQTYKTQTRGL